MNWLFGKPPGEILKQNQRALNKAQRDLDRERTKLEQQEKKLIVDIKKAAKQGQMGAAHVMAKDLVRTRKNIQKFYQTRTQIQAISLQIQTFRSNQQMADSMRGVTKAIKSMNKSFNLPQIQKIMMDFERESEMMDMKQETMNDAIDDVMEDDESEDVQEEVVNQILEEIGIDLHQSMGDAPSKAIPGGNIKEDDLQSRLNSLRGE